MVEPNKMNWDQFKQGSWWFLEISRPQSFTGVTQYVFMVVALRKGNNERINKVKARVTPVGAVAPPFMDVALGLEDPEYTVTPIPNRHAAMDLLHILRRNRDE